jgi:RNA polymerase sigma factor (sigma-70 family)
VDGFEVSAEAQASDRPLLARLVGRLGPYVRDNHIKQSRVRRVLDSLHLEDDRRAVVEKQITQALIAAGIGLVHDDNAPGLAVSDLPTPTTATSVLEKQPPDDAGPSRAGEASELEAAEARAAESEAFETLGTQIDTVVARTAARAFLARRQHRTPGAVLLSPEQEAGLAILMRNPDADPSADLPPGYRKSLPDGSEAARAHDALVIHNVRLVWSIAKRYDGQLDVLDLEDIASYGHIGLLRAVQKFDPTMGFKFSTYATWWIRQSVSRAVMDFGRAIRIPVHMGEKINRTQAAYTSCQTTNLTPTVFRLAAMTGFDEMEIRRHLNWLRRIHSLDAPVGDSGFTLGQLLPAADDDVNSLSGVERRELRADIDLALRIITEREASVLRMRFGLVDGEPWTLEHIGRELDVTRERIRQIEKKAMETLQNSPQMAGLRIHIET